MLCRMSSGSTARPEPSHESLTRPRRAGSSGCATPPSITLMTCGCLRLGRCPLLSTQARPLLAIQHIGSRHIVLARAHETKFDLVLNVFYVQGAAARLTTHESVDDQFGKPGDLLANARRQLPGCR